MKIAQKKVIKFTRLEDTASFLKKQPLKFLCSLIDYISGAMWFYRKTRVLQEHSCFDERTVAPSIFPCFNIDYDVSMPKENPFLESGGKVIVANHEGFFLDGLFLSWLINKYRSDFKFVANSLLNLPLFENFCFFLDLRLIKKKNANKNALLYRQIINWLKQGGIVVIFPEIQNEKKRTWLWEKKLPWSSLPGFLAKAANVPIIPIKLSVPMPCFIRCLCAMRLFFYNIKMRHIAYYCQVISAFFSCRQIEFSENKSIQCVIGSAMKYCNDSAQGNYLRDHVSDLAADLIE